MPGICLWPKCKTKITTWFNLPALCVKHAGFESPIQAPDIDDYIERRTGLRFHDLQEYLSNAQEKEKYLAETRELARLLEANEKAFKDQEFKAQLKKKGPTAFDDYVQKSHFEVVNYLEEMSPVPKMFSTFSVVFIGNTNAGKSSCINKLYKADAAVSSIVCTQNVNIVEQLERPNTKVLDMFGKNDEESYLDFDNLSRIRCLHLAVYIYSESINVVKHDLQKMAAVVPILFVRSKVDKGIDQLALDSDLATIKTYIPAHPESHRLMQCSADPRPEALVSWLEGDGGMQKLLGVIDETPEWHEQFNLPQYTATGTNTSQSSSS